MPYENMSNLHMSDVNLTVITTSPSYMNQAMDELRTYDKDLKIVENLGNGVILIKPSMDKYEFNSIVIKNKPIFVRHINTIDYIMDSDDKIQPQEIIRMVENYAEEKLKSSRIAVQIRKLNVNLEYSPLEIKEAVDLKLKSKFNVECTIKDPEKIISILITDKKCYIGLSDAERNLSNWTGGMIHYKKDDNDISRAKFKLMEALNVFKVDISSVNKALDLGAAPGGWTSVLLDNNIAVTAVDTGDMDARLLEIEKLTFIKQNVSELKLDEGSFDMLTSDISWNPLNTAKMILRCSDFLKQNGVAIVTVKLMNSKITKTIKDVTNIYAQAFDIINAKQLFHNRDEITLYMKKI